MNGFFYRCEKCDHEYMAATKGVPYFFTGPYEETRQEAIDGKYGEEIAELVKNNQYAYIDISENLYYCSKCREWSVESNLAVYYPKDVEALKKRVFGIKTVEEWGYIPSYISEYELEEEYTLMKIVEHRCPRCGKEMKKKPENSRLFSKLPCPVCKHPNHPDERLVID